jgi:tRNA threonylcarbamoyl adenosine modification protein YjeE
MQAVPPAFRLTLTLADEGATARLAEDVAAALRPGDLVALSGGLGAGKTSFARALIRALADDPAREVPSPTFPLRVDYVLPRLKVVHADLYRIGTADELGEIGLGEALTEAALLVEWPELLPPGFAEHRLDIALEIAGEGRRAEISASGSWSERLARTRQIRAYLDRASWTEAARHPLAGDASVRAYERVIRAPLSPPLQGRDGDGGEARGAERPSPLPDPPQGGTGTAILMNAPARPEGPKLYGGCSYDAVAHRSLDVRPFVAIDLALREAGMRAPEILISDLDAGLLLLEDLGDEGILDAVGMPIMQRYEAAIDLLLFMHGRTWPDRAPLPDGTEHSMPPYDREALLVEVSLFPDWFGADANAPVFSKQARSDFLAAWSDVLAHVKEGPRTWVLRDFHSPNILWQAKDRGILRVGIIDFQDALVGDPAYDVASLSQDARAPLSPEQEAALKSRYIAGRRANNSGFDAERFETAYAVFAAQRATKVLGAFARLAAVEAKPGYQRHRERLKALLSRTLRHPVLSALRLWYEPYL